MITPFSETFPPALLLKYPNKVFVETGVRSSNLSAYALEVGFDRSYAIDTEKNVIERLKRDYPQVHSYLGKSENILSQIIKEEKQPITYWLDAHTESEPQYTPLPQELKAISISPFLSGSVIIIDDLRIMRAGSLWGKTYKFEQLTQDIFSLFSSYDIEYIDSKIQAKDIMVIKCICGATS